MRLLVFIFIFSAVLFLALATAVFRTAVLQVLLFVLLVLSVLHKPNTSFFGYFGSTTSSD